MQISQNWLTELQLAAQGQLTSLLFAKHRLPAKNCSSGKNVVAVVGGSYLVVAQVTRGASGIKIFDYQRQVLPKLTCKEVLCSVLANHIPADTDHLVVNLAYAINPQIRDQRLDGVLIASGKEHLLADLVGQLIGLELENYLQPRLGHQISVTVVNDLICVLLAGLMSFPAETLAGGVVGTGFNFGFFLDQDTLVNLESANFDKFPPSVTGRIVCQNSVEPKRGWYEKEVSGAYLYQHYNLIADTLGVARIESTEALSKIAQQDCPTSGIAQNLFEHSAALTAAQIAGLYWFKQERVMHFVVEGSLFWHGWNYPNLVYKYLNQLGIGPTQAKISKIANSSVVGAARLLL